MRHSFSCLAKIIALIPLSLGTSSVRGASDTGDTTLTRVTVHGTEVREFDWAKSRARARVAYVSSGPKALRGQMIDNDLQTVFRFAPTDPTPTVVVELAQGIDLNRVSTAFKADGAKLDLYLTDALPKDFSDFRSTKPTASANDLPDEHGMVNVDVSVSGARYVILRWTKTKRDEPFEVAEISAFSSEPADLILDQQVHVADNGANSTLFAPPAIGMISP